MGKVETAKKVIKSVGSVATGTVETATNKDGNTLLILILIVIVWLFLFFSKGDGN